MYAWWVEVWENNSLTNIVLMNPFQWNTVIIMFANNVAMPTVRILYEFALLVNFL